MVRKKNRYLLADVVFEDGKVHEISGTTWYQAIRAAYTEGFGEYGVALVKKSLAVSAMG